MLDAVAIDLHFIEGRSASALFFLEMRQGLVDGFQEFFRGDLSRFALVATGATGHAGDAVLYAKHKIVLLTHRMRRVNGGRIWLLKIDRNTARMEEVN